MRGILSQGPVRTLGTAGSVACPEQGCWDPHPEEKSNVFASWVRSAQRLLPLSRPFLLQTVKPLPPFQLFLPGQNPR